MKKPIAFLLMCAAMVCSIDHVADAQTRFEWPAPNPLDISRYPNAASCLAVTLRIRDSLDTSNPIWRDTMPFRAVELTQPVHPIAADFARRCSAQFDPKTVSLKEFVHLISLYLMAERDDAAATIVQRRLAEVPADITAPATAESHRARANALDTLASLYLQARPVRFIAADPLIAEIVKLGNALPWTNRFALFSNGLYFLAKSAGDTTRARFAAEQIIAISSSLTEEEKRSPEFSNSWLALLTAKMYLQQNVLLDSLRHSTSAFVSFQRNSWAELTGETALAFKLPIGEHAQPLSGEYWFPSDAANKTYPTRGKLTLVVFGFDINSGTRDQNAVIRRLAKRYPSLDIVIVAQTHGWRELQDPLSPQDEAAMIKEDVDFESLPVTLVVSKTPFWHLPGYDRRRIDRPTDNATNYAFGLPVGFGVPYLLIDGEGTVVFAKGLSRYEESDFYSVLDILEQRTTSSKQRAGL